jgi:glycerol-3-phosphate dehydrogenase
MQTVGIIGSGSFGITMAKIISRNVDVLLYSRKEEVVDAINSTHFH